MRWKWLLRGLGAFLAFVLVIVAISVFRGWRAYRDIERFDFEAEQARDILATIPDPDPAQELDTVEQEEEIERYEIESELRRRAEELGLPTDQDSLVPFAHSPLLPDSMFDSYLLVGSDLSGKLADVIILALAPSDGSNPIMASLPRDLYLPNPCMSYDTRINAALAGCGGDINGMELLSVMVEDYTGVRVDHVAKVDFEGFTEVIDALGGVEICVENPVRDSKSDLDLPAGCTDADGEIALQWVRSRSTQEYVNGAWRYIGTDDFTRQERQQDILFQLAAGLRSFSSISAFTSVAESLADIVALDSRFSVRDAIDAAWEARDVGPSDVIRLELPLEDFTTSIGAQVLLPSALFHDVLVEVYAAAAVEAA